MESILFCSECTLKFGTELGNLVFDAVNSAFDSMPLAAVIDGSIFCVHGGIPAPWTGNTLDAIMAVTCPLSMPETNQLAWNLLWNDPIHVCPRYINDMSY